MAEKIVMQGVLMGPSGSGKTSLLSTITDGAWSGNAMTTVGVDFKNKEFTVGLTNQIVNLQLWDTAGQERFSAMAKGMASRSGIGAIIIVTDWENFDRCLSQQIPQISEIKKDKEAAQCPRFILLITKKDLGGGMSLEEAEAKVKEKMGTDDLAQRVHYVSAKTDIQQLLAIFQDLANELYEDHMKRQTTVNQTISIDLNKQLPDNKDNTCCLFR